MSAADAASPTDASSPASIGAWEQASRLLAENARGVVHAVQGQRMRPGNFWETIEFPAIKENPLVTRVVGVDPKTDDMRVIWEREWNVSANELSEALVDYLGFHRGASPSSSWDRAQSVSVINRDAVESIVAEIDALNIDWSHHDLTSGTAAARAHMQQTHPELSDDALDALAWKFSFDWR